MTTLSLTPDELLSTTRSVRKRLDFDTPVDPALVRECIDVATQAPTGGNVQSWHWVVVTDPAKKAQIGEWYREGWNIMYGAQVKAMEEGTATADTDDEKTQLRVVSSANYLAQRIGESPVMVIPCVFGRTDGAPAAMQAGQWGSLLPAAWSFCLAARARGLGTCWTTLHLFKEKETAELLGLPDTVMQGALFPVAHTLGGTDFKPGPRRDLDKIIHTDTW